MPSYDWSAAADMKRERVPDGVHYLKVDRIVTGGNSGKFKSRAGDPQIMLVFVDDNCAEVSQMFTLSVKAAWTLAVLFKCAGVDTKSLKDEGIEPKHFANEALARQHLVGLRTWARVWTELGADGKAYARLEPMTATEAGVTSAPKAQSPPTQREMSGVNDVDPFAEKADEDDKGIPF